MKYDIAKPMGAARYVRKERYSWPGGYAVALLCNDGQCIRPDCVQENFSTIAYDTRHRINGGWLAAGVTCEVETDSAEMCACCESVIWEAKE